MKFKELVEKAKEEIEQFDNSLDNYELGELKSNEHKREILRSYLQYVLIEKTHRLVKATWILAIATIMLVIITK